MGLIHDSLKFRDIDRQCLLPKVIKQDVRIVSSVELLWKLVMNLWAVWRARNYVTSSKTELPQQFYPWAIPFVSLQRVLLFKTSLKFCIFRSVHYNSITNFRMWYQIGDTRYWWWGGHRWKRVTHVAQLSPWRTATPHWSEE